MDAIVVDSISKVYGDRFAVKDLSFRVKKGSIHGFLGPNGAGKTTTLKIISGIMPALSGHVYINGNKVQDNLLKIKSHLGVLLEKPPLYKDMEVREYLEYICRLHKVSHSDINEYVQYALEKLALSDVSHRIIGNLSKGYQQRVGVAQAIVFQPDIVILDEPTVGLDPNSVIEMRSLIKELANDHTVLLSSHLLHEIGLICDEVTIINKGELQASGSVADIAQKIKQNEILTIIVKHWSSQLEEDLLKHPYIESIVSENIADTFRLSIKTNSQDENRDHIAKFLVEKQAGLLELKKQSMDLEQLFLKITGDQS